MELINNKRAYGIDLLKMLSMYMVVLLHILGQGDILNNSVGIRHYSYYTIEIAAYCAVNCFAMITGYLMCDKKTKYSRIISLWLEVVSYSVALTILVSLLTSNTVSLRAVINACLPVTYESYWYFTDTSACFYSFRF